jgi:hypothetical protein
VFKANLVLFRTAFEYKLGICAALAVGVMHPGSRVKLQGLVRRPSILTHLPFAFIGSPQKKKEFSVKDRLSGIPVYVVTNKQNECVVVSPDVCLRAPALACLCRPEWYHLIDRSTWMCCPLHGA